MHVRKLIPTTAECLMAILVLLLLSCGKDTQVLTDDTVADVPENPFAGFDFSNVDIPTTLPDTHGDGLNGAEKDGLAQPADTLENDVNPAPDSHGFDGFMSPDGSGEITPQWPRECVSNPTGLGCPCAAGADCASNVCVPSPMGDVCAGECGTGCIEGFGCTQLPDEVCPRCPPLCIPTAPYLCKPCTQDSECQAPFGDGTERCANHQQYGAFCGIGCIPTNADCPTGTTCTETTTVHGEPTFQCQPTVGECLCSPLAVNESAKTACEAQQDSIPCPGLRTCTSKGLSPCVPTPSEVEVCDGIDNNCSGETDEGTCPTNQACFCTQAGCGCDCDPTQTDCNPICVDGQTQDCVGECGPGVQPCVNNDWGECDAPKPLLCMDWGTCQSTPQCVSVCPSGPSEQCNAKDDNCNGQIDDGFACLAGQTETTACTGQCGTKSRSCNGACAWGDWSGCSGGPCVPGQTETQKQGCGNCGEQSRTRTCDAGCTWGAWGAWGGCGSQGVCAPGAKQGCPDCREMVCQSNCTWSACKLAAGAACTWENGKNYQCCGKGKWQFCSKECQWFPCSNCAGAPYYCDTNCP